MTLETKALPEIAKELRRRLLRMHFGAKSNHIGTALSEIDLLVFLFGQWLGPDDQFVLSKGHGASGLYATLNYFQQMPEGMIETYYQDGTKLAAHPCPGVLPRIPIATGSLGHGLSVACGLALGAKLKGEAHRKIICLASDGECNEGTIWEASLFASHHQLSNLTLVIDLNGIQGFGRSEEVLNMKPYADKFRSFGYQVIEINGHDFLEMATAFGLTASENPKPLCILAHTIKGKGVSFMEDTVDWHYLNLTPELLERALQDVDSASLDHSEVSNSKNDRGSV